MNLTEDGDTGELMEESVWKWCDQNTYLQNSQKINKIECYHNIKMSTVVIQNNKLYERCGSIKTQAYCLWIKNAETLWKPLS